MHKFIIKLNTLDVLLGTLTVFLLENLNYCPRVDYWNMKIGY